MRQHTRRRPAQPNRKFPPADFACPCQPAAIVISLVALIWTCRLAADEPQPNADPPAPLATLTCTGAVQDALYGKPLAGAKVTIWILAKPESAGEQAVNSVGRIEAVTDADGKYTYQLPIDHPYVPPESNRGGARENPFIPLEIEASVSGYAVARIEGKVYPPTAAMLESLQRSEPTEGFTFPVEKPIRPGKSYWDTIGVLELRPGNRVTGMLQSTDGKPVAGAKIIAHSQIPLNERKFANTANGDRPDFTGASREEAVSDAQGRFRVTMITPGEGMLMIFPTDQTNAPLVKTIYDQRGDLGIINLPRGQVIEGVVRDVAGKPLVGVPVGAQGNFPAPRYSDYRVDQQLRRAGESDAQGHFAIGALPPGEYRVEPNEQPVDAAKNPHELPARRPLPGIFLPQKVSIADAPLRTIEFRAVASVVVSGQFIVDTPAPGLPVNNEPVRFRGWRSPYLRGTFNDLQYRQSIQIDDEGNFKMLVPKGLSGATIQLFTEQGNLRPQWRLGGEQAMHNDLTIDLGVVNDDVPGIEIDYTSPFRNGRGGGFGGRGAAVPQRGAAVPPAARTARAAPTERGGQAAAKAAESDAESNAKEANKPATKEEGKPKEINGTGTVIDADDGQPIEGAKVTIWEYELSRNDGVGLRYLNHYDAVTDAGGKYRVTISTDHAETLPDGRTVIRVEADAKHDDYVAPSVLPRMQDLLEVEVPAGLSRLNMSASEQARLRTLFESGAQSGAVAGLSNGRLLSRTSGGPIRELSAIEMIPAKAAWGVLQSPEGKPVAGVRIWANPTAPVGRLEKQLMQSLASSGSGLIDGMAQRAEADRPYGVDETVTDESGRFRFQLPTNGKCELRIWPATEYVPMEIQAGDKRGDLGTFTLQRGSTLSGHVVDLEGRPLAGIYIEARQSKIDGKPAFGSIFRATMTDPQGNFRLAPLPANDYHVEPRDVASDLSTERPHAPPPEKHPLPGFFTAQSVTLTAGKESPKLEFRTIPAVLVAGQLVNTKELLDAAASEQAYAAQIVSRFGSPTFGGAAQWPSSATLGPNAATTMAAPETLIRDFTPSIRGSLNGSPFTANADINPDGKFTVKVPLGLTDAVLHLRSMRNRTRSVNARGGATSASTTTEPQWRLEASKPFVTGLEVPIGAVGEGVHEIEVRYLQGSAQNSVR